MIWVLSILASMGLDSGDWQAGLKHFGCAAYLQRAWQSPEGLEAQTSPAKEGI